MSDLPPCAGCKRPVQLITMTRDGRPAMVDPDDDPQGSIEITRGGSGWVGRPIGRKTRATDERYRKVHQHECGGGV